ncbi:MAG: carboxypeptidase-like regulatory domain-containing protein, partial [Bacteroidia bacterium]
MLRLQLTFLFLIIFFRLSAQYSVEGKIIDASGKQPLAFVNIGIAGSQQTTSSDIDGKFK